MKPRSHPRLIKTLKKQKGACDTGGLRRERVGRPRRMLSRMRGRGRSNSSVYIRTVQRLQVQGRGAIWLGLWRGLIAGFRWHCPAASSPGLSHERGRSLGSPPRLIRTPILSGQGSNLLTSCNLSHLPGGPACKCRCSRGELGGHANIWSLAAHYPRDIAGVVGASGCPSQEPPCPPPGSQGFCQAQMKYTWECLQTARNCTSFC